MKTAPYALPDALIVDGVSMPIRTDYRAALDVIRALNDQELNDEERAYVALVIIYRDLDMISVNNAREAFREAMWFLGGGSELPESQANDVRLMDWDQDFQLIVAPINKVAGCEIRAVPYMHWWTFLAYYREIGDCAFAQVVSIRAKQKKHKNLEKWETEFYRDNRALVDLRVEHQYTEQEDNAIMRLIRR